MPDGYQALQGFKDEEIILSWEAEKRSTNQAAFAVHTDESSGFLLGGMQAAVTDKEKGDFSNLCINNEQIWPPVYTFFLISWLFVRNTILLHPKLCREKNIF